MQLDIATNYYLIDIFSSYNTMFNLKNGSILEYLKNNFPILYELELERQQLIGFNEKYNEHYKFILRVLEYLNLPQYIVAYSSDKQEFYVPTINIKLTYLNNDIQKLDRIKVKLEKIKENLDVDFLTKKLNFFVPLPETKKKANYTKEELIEEMKKHDKCYIKNILKKGMNKNDN